MPLENYLSAQWNVPFPVLSVQMAGSSSKTQEGRTSFSHFQTVLANDTYQAVYPSTVFTVQGIPGVDSATIKLTIQNKSSLDVLDWSTQIYTHQFPGVPNYNGLADAGNTTRWSGNPNNGPSFSLDQGILGTVFWDGNKWCSVACEDLTQPTAFNFEGRFTPAGNLWYLDIRPINGGVSPTFCQYPIKSGTSLTTTVTFRFFPNATAAPSLKSVAPDAYKVQASKFPLLVNKTKFPDCLLLGALFMTPTPDSGTNTGTNAPLTTLATAFTVPAVGSTAVANLSAANANVKAGARVGLAANMTNGKVVGPTFAVTAINGTAATLKNDDLKNANYTTGTSGATIPIGTNVFQDWSYNPRRWAKDPTFKIINPATGNLFALSGDYSGLNAVANHFRSTMQFATDVLAAKANPGTLIPQNRSGYNPSLYTGSQKNPFGGLGIICWDIFYGGEYPQPQPSYLGASYNAVTPGKPGFIPEIAYTDSTFTTALITTANHYMGICSDGTVVPNFIKGCGLRGSFLKFDTSGNLVQNTYPSVGDLTFGQPGNLTIPNNADQSVHIWDAALKVKTFVQYGFNAAYWDSWGPFNTPGNAYDSQVLRCLLNYAKNALNTDILLIPESYGRDDVYSASCPWMGAEGGQYNTRESARAAWPQASGNVRWENTSSLFLWPLGDGRTNATNYANTVTHLKKALQFGTHFMAQCTSGTPNEAQMVADMVNKIGLGLV